MEKKYYFRGLGLGIIVTAVIMGIALSGGGKTSEMTDDEVIARARELGMTEDTRLLEPSVEEEKEPDGANINTGEAEQPVKKDVAVKAEAEASAREKEGQDSPDGEADTAQAEQKPVVDTPEPIQNQKSDTEKPTARTAPTAASPKPDTNEMTKQDDVVKSLDDRIKESNAESDKAQEGSDAASANAGTKNVTIASGDGSYTVAKKLEQAGVVASAASFDTYLCEHGYDKKLRTGTFHIPANATDEQIARIVTGQK